MDLSLFEAVILVLALARLTRLVVADEIFRPLRNWTMDRSTWFGYLVTCPWCMSVWLATAVFGATYLWGHGEWLWWIWGGFAASYCVGLLAEKVED